MNERASEDPAATLREELQKLEERPVPDPPGSNEPLAGQERTREEENAHYQQQAFIAAVLIRGMSEANYVLVTNTLRQLGLDMLIIATFRDGAGMTPLHAACRLQDGGTLRRSLRLLLM